MIAEDINKTLENTFDAISVLLVFVTVIFGMRYPEIQKILDEKLIRDKEKASRLQRKKFLSTLYFKWLPVVFLIGICTYTMSPLAIYTIDNSSFSLLKFDFIRTCFILIWLLTCVFLVASIYIAIVVFIKSIKLKK